MDNKQLIKSYLLLIIKDQFYDGINHPNTIKEISFDTIPDKKQVVECIKKHKGDYAELKIIYKVEECKENVFLTANQIIHMSDVNLDNVLFYRIINPHYSEAVQYEGSIKNPKQGDGWYSFVSVVKTAVRNGLSLYLYSQNDELCKWANDYLDYYRS